MKLIKVNDEDLHALVLLLAEGFKSEYVDVQILSHIIAGNCGVVNKVKEVVENAES